ncbi:MaoC/PaaZ C-terminal domain-containing protein [Chitinimonas sp. BJB300]|uniref:MaoC/PaaZ C-terminal domain-containing protein n=1 Tax=Chitinimonas sp. BJB300 TaxID=1559339 RepID=UPI000C0E59E2|nr:MaoC/PaaZ C-terminal domain-containing protein [Chitinimonas sp. BJB300]PHV13219.1 dehydratase [Chitinimonas sp. BJB300]TSJ89612.1 dehydratase [Chitinimonas sp. BJB300]
MTLYFEDLKPGRVFKAGPIAVEPAAVRDFAQQYDPQAFHLDEAAGIASVFGSQVASGWQTAAYTMRMMADSELARIANGLVGLQVDKLMWHQPVKPGDVLTAEFDVMGRKHSRSKPDFGVVQLAWRTFNQQGDLVMSLECAIWVAVRGQ